VADTLDSTAVSLDRRDFFKGAALGAAGLVVTGKAAEAAPIQPPIVELPVVSHDLAYAPPQSGAATAPRPAGQSRPASDFMVDVLKKIGFEYAAVNPGSTFQGLHESLVNYGGNSAPELLTCLHEEAAAAMAHGYAKASGKPMLVVVHGTVGLLHSSMALFQAWADRVPVVIMVGHHRNPTGVINRPHSAQDMGLLVRSFVKFDDEATTLERFAESAMRAYRIAMTPPMGPVLLTVSAELQESLVTAEPRIPELTIPAPPQGDAAAVREAARLLVNAQSPLIQIAKVGRTPKAWDLLVELAETLQAPVDVMGYSSWQKFPSWHPLYGTGGSGYTPDVTLGLEVTDMSAQARTARANGRKTISISAEHLFQGSNIHDYGRYADVDIAIAADGDATLPVLIEEIRRQITPERKSARGGGTQGDPARQHRRRASRMGREPGERSAPDRGTRGPDRQRRLGDRLGPPVHGRLAAPAPQPRQAVSVQRRLRRLRHRLRHAGVGGRGAGAQEGGPPVGGHRRRRRPELQSRRDLDGGAPQDPAAARRAQQPRVPR
jgi:thiamine pyrophosphate-dependent acetolactate synthase large subunit-like protein